MLKIAHIINVAQISKKQEASYLHVAQPVTMESMLVASKEAKGLIEVDLFATKHVAEKVIIPPEFNWAPDIGKYAWEYIDSLKNVIPRKPLPRIIDIVKSLYKASSADYFVYTNCDIGLFPDFYIKVFNFIRKGHDAFCVNRRTLPKKSEGSLLDQDKMELIFKLQGKGIVHEGIDCFVFKREIVPLLNLGNVYIGYPPVGQVLLTQIKINSKSFAWFKNEFITFHLGDDKVWGCDCEVNAMYRKENVKQARGLYEYCFKENLIKKILKK